MIEKRPEIVESDSTENVGHSVDITVSNAVEKPLDEMGQQRTPDGLGDAEYDAGAQSLPSITTRSEAQPAFENALNDDEIGAAGDDKIIIQETVDPTINDSIETRLVAAGPSLSDADSRPLTNNDRPAPFARSNLQQTVGKPSKKRPRKGSPDDYPQILLHNGHSTSVPSVGKRSLNQRGGYYTKLLHKLPRGVCLQGNVFHLRRRVPNVLQTVIGRSEIWRSLRTDSPQIAVRRFHFVAASSSNSTRDSPASEGIASE